MFLCLPMKAANAVEVTAFFFYPQYIDRLVSCNRSHVNAHAERPCE